MNSSGACGITRRIKEMQHVLLIIVMLKKNNGLCASNLPKKNYNCAKNAIIIH
jgi:hypothetical protein